MSLFRPLKALKIRLFSTFQIPENCCQIRKKTLTVCISTEPSRSFFILNCISCFHMIFFISLAESFALKLDKTVCPKIFVAVRYHSSLSCFLQFPLSTSLAPRHSIYAPKSTKKRALNLLCRFKTLSFIDYFFLQKTE